MTRRPRAALLMGSEQLAAALFPPPLRVRLDELVELHPRVLSDIDPAAERLLADVEVLITGWRSPRLTSARLAAMPALRAVVHAGGRAGWFIEADPLERDLALSNAGQANAVPVAEFALAAIILSGKGAFAAAGEYRADEDAFARDTLVYTGGNFGRRIGVVGASRVGRLLIEMLQGFDFDVVVYDPYLGADEAADLGVQVLELDELLASSDVVSLHVPDEPSTRAMIGRRELGLMRDGATLINTARGLVIDQDALVDALRTGRLSACLDTTDPEILPRGHELYRLPNVFLTPHIAGSMGNELQRMGESVVAEVARYVQGAPFAFAEAPGALA